MKCQSQLPDNFRTKESLEFCTVPFQENKLDIIDVKKETHNTNDDVSSFWNDSRKSATTNSDSSRVFSFKKGFMLNKFSTNKLEIEDNLSLSDLQSNDIRFGKQIATATPKTSLQNTQSTTANTNQILQEFKKVWQENQRLRKELAETQKQKSEIHKLYVQQQMENIELEKKLIKFRLQNCYPDQSDDGQGEHRSEPEAADRAEQRSLIIGDKSAATTKASNESIKGPVIEL